jgi:hypothetical protein
MRYLRIITKIKHDLINNINNIFKTIIQNKYLNCNLIKSYYIENIKILLITLLMIII